MLFSALDDVMLPNQINIEVQRNGVLPVTDPWLSIPWHQLFSAA